MYRLLPLLTGCLLLPPATATAADPAAARAVIDRAVASHGGEARLARALRAARSVSGTLNQFGDKPVPFKDESVVDLPSRYRSSIDLGEGAQKIQVVLIVSGERAWESAAGAVRDLSGDRLAELREEMYVLWVTTLAPLVRGEGFELDTAPETKVGGQPAAGVKVSRKGSPDVVLYFDRASNLLVKVERRAVLAGAPVKKEYLYEAHKPFEGVLLPTRMTELMNGRKFSEVTSCTYRFLDRAEDRLFARP